MITLSYTVAGQLIEPASVPQYLVADTVGVYQVAFTFDADWADMGEKTVVFRNPQVIDPDYRDVPVGFPLDANGQALVPAALLDPGKLFIGVYGTNSTQQFPTIWAPPLQVVPGASPGVEPSDDPALGTVIRTIPQTLTEEEKAQARENIGANEVADGTPGNVVIIGSNQNISDSGISKDNLLIAPQLASNNIKTDSVPYIYRQTVGGIGVGNREYDSIVGGSVVHQQKINPTMMMDRSALGVTLTRDGNGGITVTGTPTATNNLYFINGFSFATHVYLFGAEGSTANHGLMILSRKDTGGGVLLKVATAQTGQITYFFTAGEALNVSTKPYIYDLTEMFGTAVADRLYAMEQASAGSGIAVLNAMGLNQYRPYTAEPSLLSAMPTAHKTVGFNQWDEEWESGTINSSGQNAASTAMWRTKNYIPVFPGQTYYICQKRYYNTYNFRGRFYDSDKNFLTDTPENESSLYNKREFVVPSGAYYLRFSSNTAAGESKYGYDVCVNISDPTRNGEYEPYEEHTYPLAGIELRGVPAVDSAGNIYFDGDTYAPDGTVTRRYGIVDLGTLTWNYTTYSGISRFYTTLGDAKKPSATSETAHAICPNYLTIPQSDAWVDGVLCITTAGQLNIFDNAYSSAAAFKAAMSGVNMVYELATPTVETAAPYDALQICDPLGTEEYVTTGICPVGHETRYPENQVRKLDGLPSDFSTLIAPTEKEFKASATRTTGFKFIYQNQLYKCIANVASGAAYTIGTNVKKTTIAEELDLLS